MTPLALRFGPWGLLAVAVAVAVAGLLQTRATLARVKLEHQVSIADATRDLAVASEKAARKAEAAAGIYAERTAALQPIILRSKDTVTRYAQTPAGRADCLNADRVRGFDALDADLFTPPGAAGAAGAVRPDAGASPAGR